jgi:Protein of unknown function DUF262
MSSGLDARPGAITLGLDDLVDLAWKGRIRVPHFHRDFKWTRQDVIWLFDSILRRYPIGSLLLWRRPAPRQRVVLGAIEIDAVAMDDARWVVDGQQRITSLANVLHPEGQRDARFALGYNLQEECIVGLPPVEDPLVVPLHVVFDLAKVLTWFADHPEVVEHQAKAFGLTKHLREFGVPVYQVFQDDIHVLQDIFDRMNNYGKRLSRAEVFSALNAETEAEAGDRLTIDRIAEHIDDRFGFGMIDAETALRAILARRSPDIQRDIRLEFDDANRHGLEFRNEDEDTALAEGEKAVERAVAFLGAIGVPHFTFLPYKYLLIVLTRVFAHHPVLDPTNSRLLGRWFWRAALLGPEIFKGSATGAAHGLCGRVRPDDLTGSVRDLLGALDRPQPGLPELRHFRTNEAATKIVLCSWWDLGPRDPNSGLPYEQPQLAETLTERSTAADAVRYLVPYRQVPQRYRLWAANRVLMPSIAEPTNVVGDALVWRPPDVDEEQWQQVHRSHGITPEIAVLLASDDVERLLVARQTELAQVLESFLQRKCEWGFENTPPLAEMVIEDLSSEEGDDAV